MKLILLWQTNPVIGKLPVQCGCKVIPVKGFKHTAPRTKKTLLRIDNMIY